MAIHQYKSPLSIVGFSVDDNTAVGVAIDNDTTLATDGAKLLSVRNNGVEKWYLDKDGTPVSVGGTNVPDATGTPGDTTQNSIRGRVAIASGAANIVVTNSKVSATSMIVAVLQSNDSTLKYIESINPANGSFTIQCNANATAAVNIAWKLEL